MTCWRLFRPADTFLLFLKKNKMLTFENKRFIEENQDRDVEKIAFKSFPAGVDSSFVLNQIKGRQILKNKIPSWYRNQEVICPPPLSLEQASSEATARYKAKLIKADSLVDLTGGFGIDCAFLAPNFQQVTYVEQQAELCRIATHNFQALGLSAIQIVNADSVSFLQKMPSVDVIYMDPARRDKQGRKVSLLEDCSPHILEISGLLLQKSNRLLIKLSPMFDVEAALVALPNTAEVHIVAIDNDCKEVLLLLQKETPLAVKMYCVNLQPNKNDQFFVFDRKEEYSAHSTIAKKPLRYLYEPNVAVLKSSAFKLISEKYHVDKLQVNSHLYTSENLVYDFPGRSFEVETVFSLNKQEMKSNLQGIEKANIAVRNFPATVAELRKKTKLKEGGDVYLFATTLSEQKKVMIRCKKV